jgi:hypothetical protein
MVNMLRIPKLSIVSTCLKMGCIGGGGGGGGGGGVDL